MRKPLTAEQVAALVPDGATVMIGGFLGVGSPKRVIDALVARGAKGLTVIGNDTGRPDLGIGRLIVAGCVSRAIVSHIGTNPVTQQKMIAGEMRVDLVPQGTLAERMRAGGSGIAAFFTRTGVGTQVATGGLPWRYDAEGGVAVASPAKETREFRGHDYVLEEGIVADFGLVRAWKGDRHGNLVFRDSARNFNPLAAMCGRLTIAEVEVLVEPGELDPNEVHTPGVFVQRVVPLTAEQAAEKRIEKRTTTSTIGGGAQ